jgi:hypothetical protein
MVRPIQAFTIIIWFFLYTSLVEHPLPKGSWLIVMLKTTNIPIFCQYQWQINEVKVENKNDEIH